MMPPTAVPQVAEANTETELPVALRTSFHCTERRACIAVVPRHRADEALYGGAAGELLSGGNGRAPGTKNRKSRTKTAQLEPGFI
jgi:hypothetical protein